MKYALKHVALKSSLCRSLPRIKVSIISIIFTPTRSIVGYFAPNPSCARLMNETNVCESLFIFHIYNFCRPY